MNKSYPGDSIILKSQEMYIFFQIAMITQIPETTNITLFDGSGGGGAAHDLPKFRFLVEFPIGLHIILQLQIRKFKTA